MTPPVQTVFSNAHYQHYTSTPTILDKYRDRQSSKIELQAALFTRNCQGF
ncbi:MAG: hypothetical protein MGU50_09920 [Trichodesmium sp. MAG_R02]|nr:hypothetical protein [Trichodesmium sp. MAG_R02]